jgi:hypothetical protein
MLVGALGYVLVLLSLKNRALHEAQVELLRAKHANQIEKDDERIRAAKEKLAKALESLK